MLLCSPLFILLKALVVSGPTDDMKRESSESISLILGILRAIKMSEDAVDEKKSNVSILQRLLRLKILHGCSFLLVSLFLFSFLCIEEPAYASGCWSDLHKIFGWK